MYNTKNNYNAIEYMKIEINRLLKKSLPSNIISDEEFKNKYDELCNDFCYKHISNKP